MHAVLTTARARAHGDGVLACGGGELDAEGGPQSGMGLIEGPLGEGVVEYEHKGRETLDVPALAQCVAAYVLPLRARADEAYTRECEAFEGATVTMWSAALAWKHLWGSAEEFMQRLGPRYVVNTYRMACGVVSLANVRKGQHSMQFELSATQLAAVVMTLAPWRHGLYVWTAGLQAFALGLAFFANNCSIGPQALFCSLTNELAHMAWTAHGTKWPMNAMSMYEFQIRCMLAGAFIGGVDAYRRCKLWYIELMKAQDAAEVKNARAISEKKKKAKKSE